MDAWSNILYQTKPTGHLFLVYKFLIITLICLYFDINYTNEN